MKWLAWSHIDTNGIDWIWIHFLWLNPPLFVGHCAASLLNPQSTVKPCFDALVSLWIVVEPCDTSAMSWWPLTSVGICALSEVVCTACLLLRLCGEAVSWLFSLVCLQLPLVVPTTLCFGVSHFLPCVKGLGNPVDYNSIDQKIIMRFWATSLWVVPSGQNHSDFLAIIWVVEFVRKVVNETLLYCVNMFFTCLSSIGLFFFFFRTFE